MKCNYKKAVEKQALQPLYDTINTTTRIWEIQYILALHREFGFGINRINRLILAVADINREFGSTASLTDDYRSKKPMTNIDCAAIRMVRELRSIGIDHRKLLGDCDIILTDENGNKTNVDELVDRIEEHERRYAG